MMDPYATHLEALVQTAMETSGGILELGCGDYSTPILQAICKVQSRDYKCQSSNKHGYWVDRFGGVELITDWETWRPPPGPWGMVFMDSDESTANRVKRIPLLAEVTDTVVLHDADITMKRDGWPAAQAAFPNVVLFTKYLPHTAVMRKAC